MIYSGLEFAQYFEVETTSHCHDVLIAITPAARMTFTFIQMYFIFLNAKVNDLMRTWLNYNLKAINAPSFILNSLGKIRNNISSDERFSQHERKYFY